MCVNILIVSCMPMTVIFLSDSNPDVINSKLSSDLHHLHDWLQTNHLTINIKKTECMYFHSPKKSIPMSDPIHFANQTLTITETYKYLGVHLDSHLTYRNHIHILTKKLNQKLYVFNKIRPYLTHTVSDTYLHAIILSTISYCLPIWSLTTKEIIEPIARLYNRAYKIHSNLPPWTHHCAALSHSNALTFQNYTIHLAIKSYFQIQNNHSPPSLTVLLPRHNTTRQERITRSISLALNPVPAYKNNYGQRSFFHTYTKIWNEIPYHIRAITSISHFKQAFKINLMEGQTCNH